MIPLQNPLQNLRKHLRISLSGARFHALSHEEPEEVLFSSFVLCDLRRIVGEHFLCDGLKGSGIAHLAKLLRIDDGVSFSAVQEEFFHNNLRIGAGDLVRIHEGDDPCELCDVESEMLEGNRFFMGVEEGEENSGDIRTRFLRVSGELHEFLVEVGELARSGKDPCVVRLELVLSRVLDPSVDR